MKIRINLIIVEVTIEVKKKKNESQSEKALRLILEKKKGKKEELVDDIQDKINKIQKEVKGKVKDDVEELEDQVEELEDEIDRGKPDKPPKPPKPEKKAKRIAILNNQTHQEIKKMEIPIGSESVVTAEGRDAQNNPAPLLAGDVPTYASDTAGVVTLFPTSDGLAVEIVGVAAGACTVTVTGKDAKGGVITGSIDITVPAAEPPLATRIELTPGPVIPV